MLGNDFIYDSLFLLHSYHSNIFCCYCLYTYFLNLYFLWGFFLVQDPLLLPDLLIRTTSIVTSNILQCVSDDMLTFSFLCYMSYSFYSKIFCSFNSQVSSQFLDTIIVGMISPYTSLYLHAISTLYNLHIFLIYHGNLSIKYLLYMYFVLAMCMHK